MHHVKRWYPKDNLYYYIDGGFYSKGKSVCNRYTIRRETIEEPIIEQVSQIVGNNSIIERLADRIEAFLKTQSNDNTERNRIQRQIAEQQQGIDRIFSLVVEAGIDNEIAIPKIRELEAEKLRLMKLLQREEMTAARQIVIPRVVEEASYFIKSFRRQFRKAPVQEQKQMIRHFVRSIRVHPEERRIEAVFTKIPTTDPTFLQVVKSSEQGLRSTSGSAKCSGGTH